MTDLEKVAKKYRDAGDDVAAEKFLQQSQSIMLLQYTDVEEEALDEIIHS
jgi:hypothetical protein